jgi:hypothetical protein
MIASFRAASVTVATLFRAVSLAIVGTGLLYLIAPLVPGAGPGIPDALPLDELPGHSSAPLIPFALAWAAATWATHAFGRPTPPIVVDSIAFWSCKIALDTISLGIVRQVHLLAVLPSALTTPAPYLAAAIVAAVATVERRRARLGACTG